MKMITRNRIELLDRVFKVNYERIKWKEIEGLIDKWMGEDEEAKECNWNCRHLFWRQNAMKSPSTCQFDSLVETNETRNAIHLPLFLSFSSLICRFINSSVSRVGFLLFRFLTDNLSFLSKENGNELVTKRQIGFEAVTKRETRAFLK